tara:strand:- start:8078 stop:8350 length:273 start_codon:yes stop_codon:yes gene_type:complete
MRNVTPNHYGRWTEQEAAYIMHHYQHKSNKEMAVALKRTTNSVANQRHKLGLDNKDYSRTQRATHKVVPKVATAERKSSGFFSFLTGRNR